MDLDADLIFSDVFRRDISGWAKAGWCAFVLVLPFLGAFIYLIANGKGLTDRRVHDVQVSQANFDEHVRKVAADGGSAGEIGRAKELLDSGAIDQTEFEQLKAKALAWTLFARASPGSAFGPLSTAETTQTGTESGPRSVTRVQAKFLRFAGNSRDPHAEPGDLPSRRSRVRVPSAALSEGPRLRAFCVSRDVRTTSSA